MATLPGKEKIDKVVEDQATKYTKKAVAWLLKNALLKNGIPKAVAGPLSSYYDEHVKVFMRLVFIELKYHPEWTKIISEIHTIDQLADRVEDIRYETPVPEVTQIKAWLSAAPLFGAEAVKEAKKQQEELVRNIELVVGSLDVQLDQVAAIASIAQRRIEQTQTFLGMNKARDNMELVMGTGSLGKAQEGLCYSARTLLQRGRELQEHRNRWAELVGRTRIDLRHNLSRWEEKCAIPF